MPGIGHPESSPSKNEEPKRLSVRVLDEKGYTRPSNYLGLDGRFHEVTAPLQVVPGNRLHLRLLGSGGDAYFDVTKTDPDDGSVIVKSVSSRDLAATRRVKTIDIVFQDRLK